MEKREVLMVRVYLTEGRAKLDVLMKHLFQSGQLRGMTVLEATSGVGTTPFHEDSYQSIEGKPVILEFFDRPEKAKALLERIRELVAPRHVIMHPVTLLDGAAGVPRAG